MNLNITRLVMVWFVQSNSAVIAWTSKTRSTVMDAACGGNNEGAVAMTSAHLG